MANEKKLYDKIDRKILKAIPNPAKGAYEIKIKVQDACGERLLKRKITV